MTWALLEILVPLLLALGIGVFIGWLLFRWRRRLIHASEWNQLATNAQEAEIRAATERAAYEEANNERSMLSGRIHTLTTDLKSTKTELGEVIESKNALALELEQALGELNEARHRSDQQQRELDALEADLSVAHAERSATDARLQEIESDAAASALVSAQAKDAEARTGELEAALTAARTELDVSQSRIADFDARLATSRLDIAAAHERVSQLEAQLHQHEAETTTPSNETPLGTPAADHVDDLKVIRGIGPRMEELLTSLGITSWDQLAALDSDEVAMVDDAIREFPGRIERDEWVAQAQELVRQFPDIADRPSRRALRNRTKADRPNT